MLPCIGHEATVHERHDRPWPDRGGGVAARCRLTAFPDTHDAPGDGAARRVASAGLAAAGMRFAAALGRGERA